MNLFEEDEKTNNNEDRLKYVNEIKKKVNDMKKSEHRTTNFSLIEYFAKNDFHPLKKNELINKLLKDYKEHPSLFILANKKEIFKNEKSFRNSIIISIKRNNSFIDGPGRGELSLDLEKTCHYLKSVYHKYITNSYDVKTPIKLYNNENNKKLKEFKDNDIKKEKSDNSAIFHIKHFDNNKASVSSSSSSQRSRSNKNNGNRTINYEKYLERIEQAQSDNESSGVNSMYTLSESSIPKSQIQEKNERIKLDNKIIPAIFKERKINDDSFISSFDKDVISKLKQTTFEFFSKAKKEEDFEKFGENLKIIYISLHNSVGYKDSYDKIGNVVKKFRKEIFNIWNMMNDISDAINKLIKIKSYNYDIYKNLRDSIFKMEGMYKANVEILKNKLNELKEIEMNFKKEIKKVLKTLSSIKSNLAHNKSLLGLCEIIEEKLKLKEKFELYDYNNEDDDINLELFDSVGKTIKVFQDENKIIIDRIKNIDKNVGNIIIY